MILTRVLAATRITASYYLQKLMADVLVFYSGFENGSGIDNNLKKFMSFEGMPRINDSILYRCSDCSKSSLLAKLLFINNIYIQCNNDRDA
jgi:hypothetical protein